MNNSNMEKIVDMVEKEFTTVCKKCGEDSSPAEKYCIFCGTENLDSDPSEENLFVIADCESGHANLMDDDIDHLEQQYCSHCGKRVLFTGDDIQTLSGDSLQ